MTTPTTTGYTPPAVDLAPFRAGTVWQWAGKAYYVADVETRESARPHGVIHTLDGRPIAGEVRPERTFEVELILMRADWFDAVSPAVVFDEWTADPAPRVVHIGGQAWRPFRVDRVWTGPGYLLGGTRHNPIPGRWEIKLWRDPYEDREGES